MKRATEVHEEFTLDTSRVRRSFGRAARGYDEVAVLQAEVRSRLLGRLDLVRVEPEVIVDAGAGTGHSSLELKRRYRRGWILAVDFAEGMLREALRRQRLRRKFSRVCGDAHHLPIRSGCVDMVFSNLMLQWCNDVDAVFREWRRILSPGGLLTFTTFGPDTLVELRRAWSAADPYTHVNRFLDMHDLGDALIRNGFAEPVLDVEWLTLTYDSASALMQDLRTMGASNANAGRRRGLTSRDALAKVFNAYEQSRREGRLPASFEVVFGQAWTPADAGPTEPRRGESRIPVDKIGLRRIGKTRPDAG